MSAKRRRALSVMERLRGNEIDQVSRDMATVRAKRDKLARQKRELNDKLNRERYSDAIEAVPYIASFVDSVRTQIRQIDIQLKVIEPELAKFEEKLRELYREQKVFESVRLKDLREEQAALAKREAAELEEITILRWNR
jgi:flagellar export protein FliJ